MRINDLFINAQLNNRKLFIPYLTCGDPDLETTKALIRELVKTGADIIELGVPFSDPIADGEINQRSAMRALKNQITLKMCCELIAILRSENITIPIVLFTYFNPVLQIGLNDFSHLANQSGIDAVLVVDLPFEESIEINSALDKQQVGNIRLISPTTSVQRLRGSATMKPEFLYYISRPGVTGTQSALSDSLADEVSNLRIHTRLPIAVGFGITTPAQAARVATFADGVIVGSALVQHLGIEDCSIRMNTIIELANAFNTAIKTHESLTQ